MLNSDMKTTTQEPKKRTVRKEFLFFPLELQTITEAASAAGLNPAEWSRSVLLAEATKLLTKATVRRGVFSILHQAANKQGEIHQ